MNSTNLKASLPSSLEDIHSESDWDSESDDEMDRIVEAVLSRSATNSITTFNPKINFVRESETKNVAESKKPDGTRTTGPADGTTELRKRTNNKTELSTETTEVAASASDINVKKPRTVVPSGCSQVESVDVVDGSARSSVNSRNVQPNLPAFANFSSIYQEEAFLVPGSYLPKKTDHGLGMNDMITAIKSRNLKLSSRRYSRMLNFVDACLFGKVDTVVYMIYKEYINVNDELLCCLSGLQHACYAGQYEVVKILLELGAKPNYKRKIDGFTAIMAGSCYSGKETENLLSCVKAVIAAGGKIDVVQTNGMTALLYAVQRSHIKIVEYLLDKGADIEHTNGDGHDAVHFAKENDDSEMMALLGRHQW